jgi:hypothetical protein
MPRDEARLAARRAFVGVMPKGYGFPVNHSYWIPLSTDAAAFGPREGLDVFIFGRLRDGAAMKQAQAELSALGAHAASVLVYARTATRVSGRCYMGSCAAAGPSVETRAAL